MAERAHSTSKLKRKKLSVDEPRKETHYKNNNNNNTPQKSNNSPLRFDGTTELDKDKSTTAGPVDPTLRWWNGKDLCALENLWAWTLKSALSSLEAGSIVSDLPVASSAVTPTAADRLGKWRWPSLGEEVPPFPEEVPPFPELSTDSIPEPSPPPPPPPDSRRVTPEEELRLPACEGQSPPRSPIPPHPPPRSLPSLAENAAHPQQRPAAGGTSRGSIPCPKRHDRTPDNHGHASASSEAAQQKKSSEQRAAAPCGATAKSRPSSASVKEGQTSMQSWMKAAPPPPQQPPRVSTSNEGRGTAGAGGRESWTGVTKRPAPNSNDRPALQQGRGVDQRSMEGQSVPGPSRGSSGGGGGGGGGGERLQSCPMCLVAFPAGFLQMDIDSHLAQCLSEMNMDMTW